MPRLGIGMRWWLAAAFALIAALGALATAEVFSLRYEGRLEEEAQNLAVGRAVDASDAIGIALRDGNLERAIGPIADRRRLAVFVYGFDGSRLTADRSLRVSEDDVPNRRAALAAALGDRSRGIEPRRYVQLLDGGRATLIGLPLDADDDEAAVAAAMVAYAPRPEFLTERGLVRGQLIEAAMVAMAIAALAGLLVATLIARRLRRIAVAASAIERGSFDVAVRSRFGDELGDLAGTIDSMRVRLRESFGRLQGERDRLQRLLGRLHEGVLTVRPDLTIEYANPAAADLLGTPGLGPGDPLPDPWPDLSLPALGAGLFRQGARVSQAAVSPDDEHTFAIVGIPAEYEDLSAVLVFTDISERERRERAEREFVTNAAHELRTPLTAITSAVEVLQAGAKDDVDERDRFLGHIERESARLGRLARALLVLARAQTREEAPRMRPVAVRRLLEVVAGGLSPADGVTIEVRCDDDLAVLGEQDLVEQVIVNLAANAVKHTNRGCIVLTARRTADRWVAIEVIDSGGGIAAEERERVFDRFYRAGDRNADGFGLGLAIVRQAVRALGGRVELDAAPGGGTTARITLPAAQAVPA
jgi:signal transduction histidine kinase/HAMP domain-containing protein